MLKTRAFISLAFVAAGAVDALAQGYGGPSILSRGGNTPGRRGRAPVDFTAHVGVNGTYDSGLFAPQLQTEGVPAGVDLYGVAPHWGVYGAHNWLKKSIGVDYRGDYRRTTRNAYRGFNGTNQALAVTYQQEPTQRTTILGGLTAGVANRAFGSFASPVVRTGPTNYGVPLDEIFDQKTYFANASVGFIHRHSARLSFAGLAGAFYNHRELRSLVDTRGIFGRAAAMYAVSRRTQVGVAYQYGKFDFPRIYGGSTVHGVSFIGERRTRNWVLRSELGAYQANVFGTRTVTLSPEIAAILGRTAGIEAFRRTIYLPLVDVTASRLWEHSSFTAGYAHQISAGNGAFQTSSGHTAFTGYTYSGIRKVSLGLSAAYTRQKTVAIRVADVETYRAGVGGGYSIIPHLSLNGQLDWRKWSSPVIKARNGYTAMIGISYSTSRLPISIW